MIFLIIYAILGIIVSAAYSVTQLAFKQSVGERIYAFIFFIVFWPLCMGAILGILALGKGFLDHVKKHGL